MKYPTKLIRRFANKDHAMEFKSGKIRFGRLEYFHKIEGVRKDNEEGNAKLNWKRKSNSPIHYSATSLIPYYILCMSSENLNGNKLDKKFGEYKITITDPYAFRNLIEQNWRKNKNCGNPTVSLSQVIYNKDELVQETNEYNPPNNLIYVQKRREFSIDLEWRYVLTFKYDQDKKYKQIFWLEVGDIFKYLE